MAHPAATAPSLSLSCPAHRSGRPLSPIAPCASPVPIVVAHRRDSHGPPRPDNPGHAHPLATTVLPVVRSFGGRLSHSVPRPVPGMLLARWSLLWRLVIAAQTSHVRASHTFIAGCRSQSTPTPWSYSRSRRRRPSLTGALLPVCPFR
jgi:hypothetical protein